jgi:hypothetical protein
MAGPLLCLDSCVTQWIGIQSSGVTESHTVTLGQAFSAQGERGSEKQPGGLVAMARLQDSSACQR